MAAAALPIASKTIRHWLQPFTVVVAMLFALLPVTAGVGRANAATCPCSIWAATATPTTASDSDTAAVEVGTKFTADSDGQISALRYYKSAANTGTHVGHLWSAGGSLLATATFTGEAASGWQQVTLSTPVSITAGATYVASYHTDVGHYAADENYFASSGTDNAPLHALPNGTGGGNGVYRYGASAFPNSTFASTNYWVDVVFSPGADTTPPTVTSTTPAAGATGVAATSTVTATFSEPVQAATIVFGVTSSAGSVTGSVSYNATTRVATFTPSAALSPSVTFTATVSGAKDAAGNAMTAPKTWTFTTAAAGVCPCSIWPTNTPGTASTNDNSPVEVGVRLRSDVAGYITGLRFYKGTGNTGTHVGSLWTNSGTQLSSATFSNETATGWQSVVLPAPVQIVANTTYVASYFAPNGHYASNTNYFATAGTDRPPLHALKDNVDGRNGVYRYSSSGFPTSTFSATNYWVDVAFNTVATDTVAPTVTAISPTSSATKVPVTTSVTAAFSEPVQPSTISIALKAPDGSTVPGTQSYDAAAHQVSLNPSNALANSTVYTATVSGAKDTAGNAMAAPVTWSFTTAAPAGPGPDQGPGGPVLVLTGASNPFSKYTAEVLRTEGFNEFATSDVASVTPTALNGYDVVVLGNVPLTGSQVSMLTDWVNAGGSLIALRPDKALAGLLGLTDAGGTLADSYLKVDTSSEPGAGITGGTMQFHGTADRYSVNGATTIATLYSNASTTTGQPAVTVRSVGTNGGQAAAFTYDLDRSIVYTRQGNPAWAGQERDGQAPIRSDDLFFGGASPDYVDLTKVAVPQADEQQRLLGNLLITMDRHRMPLPKFWYFPNSAKAVVVSTGDDHGNGGTAGRFNEYQANSPAGCSVVAWQCLRKSSYTFTSTPLTNSAAANYVSNGFEIGLHPSVVTPTNPGISCGNYTPASIADVYANQLTQFAAKFPSLPPPVTSRTHCIAWSDWTSQADVEFQHGIRFDTNYYYWPDTWVNDHPGVFTGSGMPMRFAHTDGSMVDVYQAPSQMTDESGQSYPFTSDTLLDNATGPLGYYGAFVANMHTDLDTEFQDDALISSAQSRGVPVVSSAQMLTWLDARNASSFRSLSWNNGTLSFSIAASADANGLTAMIPTASASGGLSSISKGGSVSFTRQTIKGEEYAVFPAAGGDYTATYSAGTPITPARALASASTSSAASAAPAQTAAKVSAAPVISDVSVAPLPGGTASVTWTTDQPSGSRVDFGSASSRLDESGIGDNSVVKHSVVLTNLVPKARYFLRVTSTNGSGAKATSPSASSVPVSFAAAANGVADNAAASFTTGTKKSTSVVSTQNGEVTLSPSADAEFSLPRLPTGWGTAQEMSTGTAGVNGGDLALDGTRADAKTPLGPGRAVDFSARFSGTHTQSAGFGSLSPSRYAMFANMGGKLVAVTNAGTSTPTTTSLPDAALGAAHDFRIVWTKSGFRYSVDGKTVATHAVPVAAAMSLMGRDLDRDGSPLSVDWVRLRSSTTSGSFTSRLLDANQMVHWLRAFWTADVPAGTRLTVSVRTGSASTPDASWTPFKAVAASGATIGGASRYLQYRVDFATTDPTVSPSLSSIGFTNDGTPPRDADNIPG